MQTFLQNKPDLSVIIPTYCRFEPLLDTLQQVLQQRGCSFEVIVVDQNPSWPEPLLNRKARITLDSRVKWIMRDQPGVVAARHDAVEVANGDILVFIDDDVQILDPYFLARHAINYEFFPELDVVVGRELYLSHAIPAIESFPPNHTEMIQGERFTATPLEQVISFDRSSRQRLRVVSFCTCNSSVKRSSFLKVGGFDESFRGSAYGDDYDFAIRLSKIGGNFVFDPGTWLIHLQSPTGGLRFSDQTIAVTENAKIYSSVLFMLKYWTSGWRFYLLWGVLRRSMLLKANIQRPWRQPAVWLALWCAWREARKDLRDGPKSRFTVGLK